MSQKRQDNHGIVNPQGIYRSFTVGFYLAAIPISSYMTAPGGLLQKLVGAVVRLVPSTANIPQDRVISALSMVYIFFTFAGTSVASIVGQAMGTEGGLDEHHPRKDWSSHTGLPLRMRSAHQNLMELFPAFALAAGLTQTLAPTNQQLINLLGLHVLVRIFLYYPGYLLNIVSVRGSSHVLALASVVNVAYRLALGAK